MADKRVKLTVGSSVIVTGYGDDLTFAFDAHRKNKLGKYERYAVQLDIGRWQIRRLLRQIASMHVRDRERLTRELSRISGEVEAIKLPTETTT